MSTPCNALRSPRPVFLTERELAQRWRMSVKFIQKQRYAGGGVPFTKLGNAAVRYALDAVEKYEAEAVRASTSDTGAAQR